MTRAQQRELKRTAYHEAGHAVIGAVYGFWPYRATIVADAEKEMTGEVRFKTLQFTFQFPPDLTAWMVVSGLAGIAAQDRYSRRSDSEHHGGGEDLVRFYEDWWKLNALTDWNCGDPDEFIHFSEWAVKHYWYAVTGFARLLLERGTIEHDELREALASTIYTEKYERLPLPHYLCPVDLTTIRIRDVTAEAVALREHFAAAMRNKVPGQHPIRDSASMPELIVTAV